MRNLVEAVRCMDGAELDALQRELQFGNNFHTMTHHYASCAISEQSHTILDDFFALIQALACRSIEYLRNSSLNSIVRGEYSRRGIQVPESPWWQGFTSDDADAVNKNAVHLVKQRLGFPVDLGVAKTAASIIGKYGIQGHFSSYEHPDDIFRRCYQEEGESRPDWFKCIEIGNYPDLIGSL